MNLDPLELLRRIEAIERRLERANVIEAPILGPVDYAVSWTAATVNPTLGNGVLSGRYQLRGKMCLTQIYLLFGSTTAGGTGDWRFSLPFTALNGASVYIGLAHLRDSATNNYARFALISPAGVDIRIFTQLDNATNVNVINAAAPWAWGAGDNITIQIEYEIA